MSAHTTSDTIKPTVPQDLPGVVASLLSKTAEYIADNIASSAASLASSSSSSSAASFPFSSSSSSGSSSSSWDNFTSTTTTTTTTSLVPSTTTSTTAMPTTTSTTVAPTSTVAPGAHHLLNTFQVLLLWIFVLFCYYAAFFISASAVGESTTALTAPFVFLCDLCGSGAQRVREAIGGHGGYANEGDVHVGGSYDYGADENVFAVFNQPTPATA